MTTRAVTIVVSSALAVVVVAGCSSSKSTAGSGPTSTPPTTPVTSTSVPVTTPVASTISTPPLTGAANEHTQAALAAWKHGATVPSVQTNLYLSEAETDLGAAVASDSNLAATYNPAIAALKSLISIPETSDTAAQIAEAKQDVALLNTFFGTPGLYS